MPRTNADDQGEIHCSEIERRVMMAMEEEEWREINLITHRVEESNSQGCRIRDEEEVEFVKNLCLGPLDQGIVQDQIKTVC